MISEADLDLIEQYIHDELDDVQKTNVEQRLAEDEAFATHYKLIKAMPKAILTDSDAFRSDLQSIMKEEAAPSQQRPEPAKKATQVSLLRLFLSAAAVLAGITLAINLISPSKSKDLYTLNFTIPSENITTRNQAETDSDLSDALDAYNRQDFGSAIEHFREYLLQHPGETAGRFFLAISQMQQRQFNEARANLQFTADQTNPYQNAANWYLALVYIKLNQTQSAKEQLNKVISTNNSYTEKAMILLEKIS